MKKLFALLQEVLSVYTRPDGSGSYVVEFGPNNSIRVFRDSVNGCISSCALSDVLNLINAASKFLDLGYYIGVELNKPFISIYLND